VRKKIWGSETPPGQEDPYGGASVLDQRKREQELEDKREGRSVQVAPTSEELKEVGDENETSDYVAKVRWDGLDRVGYEGWGREKWDKQHPFEGFVHVERSGNRHTD